MSGGGSCSVDKAEFWGLVLAEHASSGLSVRAFCRQESLSEPSFYSWRRKLQGSSTKSPLPAGLIPVRVVDDVVDDAFGEPEPTDNAIEIIVPGKVCLRLGERCSSATLSRVLAAVRETFSC